MEQGKELEKIGKLVSLWRGGTTEAEIANALDKIKRVCKRHGINPDRVMSDDDATSKYEFQFKTPEDRRLLMQLLSMLTELTVFATFKNGVKRIEVELTAKEFINVREWYIFYRSLHKEELAELRENFFLAFISRHGLFSDKKRGNKSKPNDAIDFDLINNLAGRKPKLTPMTKIGKEQK